MRIGPHAVGIFGGSFNPIHNGHVELARELQKLCGFSPLIVIPSGTPPHKPEFETSAEDRVKMTELAMEGTPNIEVSRFEIESPGPAYAIRTIEHFSRAYPGVPIYFVLGGDAFLDLPKWYAFPDVMEACHFLVITRKGLSAGDTSSPLDPILGRAQQLEKAGLLRPTDPISPCVRTYLSRTQLTLSLLPMDLPEVSSSEVRIRLGLGVDCSSLVPNKALEYLISRGLYGTKRPN